MMAMARRQRRSYADRSIVAVLDIGTHKVCCLIGQLEPGYAGGGPPASQLRVLGVGHQRSQGIVAGGVADLRLAQSSVAAAVSQAEHAAGLRIERVTVAVTCGEPRSRTFNGHVDLPAGLVRDADIARLDAGACAYAMRDGAALLSLNRIAYGLDTTPAVREPLGLAGYRLEANHHAVTAAPGPLRNLCLLVESCQLEVSGMLPAGCASALAATTEAERRAGVVCVDLGAGITSIGGYADGHFIFCSTVPIGGQQITEELAHATALPLAQAERIKTLYASLVPSAYDEHDLVPLSDGDEGPVGRAAVTRAQLGRIAAGAMRRLLTEVRATIDGCAVARVRSSGLVVTGGGAELIGLEAFAAAELGRQVRLSGPLRLEGAAGRVLSGGAGPAFSCAVGLALAVAAPGGWIRARQDRPPPRRGYLGRVEQWLRESF